MIGILTYHFAHNYGAMLQAYALMHFLRKNGKDVEIINYCPSKIKEQYSIGRHTVNYRNFWWKVSNNRNRREQYRLFEEFRREQLLNGVEILASQLSEYANKFENIIVGSDQVWNTFINFDDPNYYLEFAGEHVKKYGFSISLGSIKMSKSMRELIDNNIDKFDRISFREQSAALFIDELFHRSYPVTCDPVFLLTVDEWKKIERKPKSSIPEKYILYYSLHNDPHLIAAVMEIADREHLPIVSIHPLCRKTKFTDYNLNDVGPREFLWLLENSEYVASNSFHASAFSIIFRKKAILRPHPVLGDRNKDLLNLVRGNDLLQKGDVFQFEYADWTKLVDLIDYSSHFLLELEKGKYDAISTDNDEHHAIIFGAKLRDIDKRVSCQSGGAATVISEYFINQGAVVYGCGFDYDLNVTYLRVTDIEDLNRIKGSKYVRANLGNTFSKIVNDLKAGKKVLFIGNACNVAGIKKLVSSMPEKDNLYTMDFICHGTPSHELYREYIDWVEHREHKKIVSFDFRYKDMSRGGVETARGKNSV